MFIIANMFVLRLNSFSLVAKEIRIFHEEEEEEEEIFLSDARIRFAHFLLLLSFSIPSNYVCSCFSLRPSLFYILMLLPVRYEYALNCIKFLVMIAWLCSLKADFVSSSCMMSSSSLSSRAALQTLLFSSS